MRTCFEAMLNIHMFWLSIRNVLYGHYMETIIIIVIITIIIRLMIVIIIRSSNNIHTNNDSDNDSTNSNIDDIYDSSCTV